MLNRVHVEFKKCTEGAKLPVYATEGSAAMDMFLPEGREPIVIPPGHRSLVGTGWKAAVPEGFAMFLYSRSGHGARQGVTLANSVGVIDSDYRGEIMACVVNHGDTDFVIHPGDRFIQASIQAVHRAEINELSEYQDLIATDRGAGGFGSTGRAEVVVTPPVAPPSWPFPKMSPPSPRQTYTYVQLGVSQAVYEEISKKLREAGYDHCFDGVNIDMSGIALIPE